MHKKEKPHEFVVYISEALSKQYLYKSIPIRLAYRSNSSPVQDAIICLFPVSKITHKYVNTVTEEELLIAMINYQLHNA